MEDFFTVVFFVTLLSFAGAGIIRTVADYRHFEHIVQQCEKQGYIQDNATRVLCSIEKREGK